MRKHLIALITIIALMSSCSKDEGTKDNDRTTGRITAKARVTGQSGYRSGAIIWLYDKNSSAQPLLQELTTGSDGSVDFGELIPGNYEVRGKWEEPVSGREYYDNKVVQVIAGEDEDVELVLE